MIVDLEEVYFPDHIRDWETNVNLGGVGSLISDFKNIRDQNRKSSPISFWLNRSYNEDSVETPGVTRSSLLMEQA